MAVHVDGLAKPRVGSEQIDPYRLRCGRRSIQCAACLAVGPTSGSTASRQTAWVGLLIVVVLVVAGDAEQHRRHAQRQRDVAGGLALGLG